MQKRISFLFYSIAVITFFFVMACTSNKNNDPRVGLLEHDKKLFETKQYSGIVDLSQTLGALFIQMSNQKLQPENWNIFTKLYNNKLLVMIKITKLKQVDQDSRLALISIVEKFILSEPLYNRKDLYIVIMGRLFWGTLKTPVYMSKHFPVDESELLKFYGPGSVIEKAIKKSSMK